MDNIKNLKINEKLLLEVCTEKEKDINTYGIISSSNYPLSGEFEVYYFAYVRNFFKNSISHRIMEINQDIPPVVKCKL